MCTRRKFWKSEMCTRRFGTTFGTRKITIWKPQKCAPGGLALLLALENHNLKTVKMCTRRPGTTFFGAGTHLPISGYTFEIWNLSTKALLCAPHRQISKSSKCVPALFWHYSGTTLKYRPERLALLLAAKFQNRQNVYPEKFGTALGTVPRVVPVHIFIK